MHSIFIYKQNFICKHLKFLSHLRNNVTFFLKTVTNHTFCRRQKMERFLKRMNISSIQSAEDLQLYGAPAFCKWNVYTKCFEEQFTRCDDCV